MTNKVWVGGGNNRAKSAANWSPKGAPAAGDTLAVPSSATINVSGNDLKGDTLSIGTSQASATDIFNLSNRASLTLNPVEFSTVDATVNVRGSDTFRLTDAGSYPNTGAFTVNLIGRSTVTGTFAQALDGGITYNGGAGSQVNNDGPSTAAGTRAVINPDVVGVGSFRVGIAQSHLGFLEFGGAVADTQSVTLSGYEERGPVTLKIDQVSKYHAPISFDKAIVDLAGVQASSYAYSGDELSLFGADGRVVGTLDLANNSTLYGQAAPIEVSHNATDVFVTTKGFFTPPGTEVLPVQGSSAA